VASGSDPASAIDLLAASARNHPGALALVTGGRTWSYADLWEGASAAAAGLRRKGVGIGDPVVIAMANGAEFFLAFFGTLIAGGIAVPVFPRVPAARLRSIAELAGARVIVTAETFDELAGAGRLESAPPDPERPCYIQYTSGSTRDPRGVVVTHANLLANIAQMIEAMSITADDVFVSWLPTYHDMGLTLMALTPFSLGTRLVLLPTDLRDVGGWLAAIETHHATFTAGPDFAYRLCLRYIPEPQRFRLSSLRVAMNASEPVRPSTVSRFESAFGLRHVMMSGYGLAEATLSVTCTPRGEPIDVDARGLACLGSPMRGTKVAASDGKRLLAQGEVGELVVSGPAVTSGYHRNARATADLFLADGERRYMRTGDLGYLDDAGRLFFVSRQKDLIKVGGRSLYPQEVESVADETPGVRLAAAVGIDTGGVAGEQLLVFAEVREPQHRSDHELRRISIGITEALHETLGVRPRATLLLRPGRIPLTANGKVQRGRLRDRYATGLLKPGGDVVFPPRRSPAARG